MTTLTTTSPVPRWRRIVGSIAGAYAVIVIALWVANWLVPTEIGLTGLITTGLQLLLFPALILLPVCLFLKRWRAATLMAVLVAAFFITYGPLLVPRAAPAPEGAPTLTLLTYNTQAPAERIAPIVEIITAADADVVALQELNSATARALEAELRDRYPYQALHPRDIDHSGQGVLSRLPIIADEYWQNEQLAAQLGHQRVILDWQGAEIALFNTHPLPPFAPDRGLKAEIHTEEITILLERARATTQPVLLAGDFNMTAAFEMYRRITATYTDAFAAVGEVGLGFTIPNFDNVPLPALVRLDYVFYDTSFCGVNAHVLPASGDSDHYPVLATVRRCRPE